MQDIHQIKLNGHTARYLHIPKPNCPTVVFLPGAVQSIENTHVFHNSLSQHFNYYFIELPGTGLTTALPAQHRFEFIADCLLEFIQHYIKGKIHLVSLSYGTMIALEFAKNYSDEIQRMVLLGSSTKFPKHALQPFIQSMHESLGDPKSFATTLIQGVISSTDNKLIPRHDSFKRAFISTVSRYSIEQRWAYIHNGIRLLAHSFNSYDDITCPTLCIAGQYDPFTTPRQVHELAKLIPNGEFTMITNADHLMHLQQPEATTQAIVNYLYKHPASMQISA